MLRLPPPPVVPNEHRAQAQINPRYDDIGQTGHLLLEALPIALGRTGWSATTRQIPDKLFRQARILPILSRFIMKSGDAPFSVNDRLDADGSIQFAHTRKPNGQVDRIVLNMWCSVFGNAAQTQGFPIPNQGERLLAGQIFAEHVLTRPFDPPETRRVVEMDFPGCPRIPPDVYQWQDPEALLGLPEGAEWIEAGFSLDAAPLVFGTDRTDPNQHVNSLVYPRIFIDAILRRFWELERRFPMRAEALEIAYRKPSFSGERVHVALRAFVHGDKLGASVVLLSNEDASKSLEIAKPRVFAQIWFTRE
jgi:hypothetical protein